MEITEPAILIRIHQLYRNGMSDVALYEATRGEWKVGPRREKAEYGFAVYRGIVREVYRIDRWHPAGTLSYRTRTVSGRDRWEFDGQVAGEDVRARYVGQCVREYFSRHSQNPVTYVNC